MAGSESAETTQTRAWPDWVVALVLLALAAGLHAWMVARTQVMARDTIGYIRYALEMEEKSWAEVVYSLEQHPGFPAYLLLVSYPIRAVLGTTPDSMMWSAQLANALAGVLLVIPMYYLAREFFGRREAFGVAVLFQVLPVTLQVTSDGLSEGLYLLMALSSLCLAAQGMRLRSVWRMGLAGLTGGLAYLTRPEGAIVVAAAGGVLLAAQWLPEWRWSWRKLSAGLACLTLGAALGGAPYVAVTGTITNKPSSKKLGDGFFDLFKDHEAGEHKKQSKPVAVTHTPGPACILAIWWRSPASSPDRPPLWWALWALVSETGRTLQYGLAVPLLIGMWFARPWLLKPHTWLLQIVGLLNALLLIWLALGMGYLSERHTLLIAYCCLIPAALGLQKVAEWVQYWCPRWLGGPAKSWLVLWLAILAVLLPTALRPLHANRAGHRAAGQWLAEHAQPWDTIVDPFCWGHYFAGHVLLEGKKPAPPPGVKPVRYVIVEKSDNPHVRLKRLPVAQELARRGSCVFTWEPTGWLKKEAEIIKVFRVPTKVSADDDL